MGEVYRGGQEALETIEAASPEENGLSLELRLLRDRVDLLHVAAREPATRWYRDVRGIVSVLALAVSLFGAAYTLVADRATEARARRHELKRIIQTLAEMRLTNARDMAVVTDQELRQRIDKAMGQLSYEHRTVLILHEFEELEYKEIARRMGCSIGTVMSRLFYARRKMATLMASYKREEMS